MNILFNAKATNSKSSMGLFYRVKLYIIINDKGELVFIK